MAPGDKTLPESHVGKGKKEPSPPIAKRPWQQPRVRTGHLFESNSLACGKNSGVDEQCVQNPLMS